MLAPARTLSSLQHRLLRELELSDLPVPEAVATAPYAARNLDVENVREALPALVWAGLVEQEGSDGGRLTLTSAGAAALYAAECDVLVARLGAVAAFADTVAQGADPRRAGYALKRLAEGAWEREQAEQHVRSGGA